MTSYVKIFKTLFRKFSPRHRSTLFCSNFVKCCRRKIGEIVRYLLHKKNKISPASQTFATARIVPKICQANPNNVLRVLQISSKSFGRSIALSRIITDYVLVGNCFIFGKLSKFMANVVSVFNYNIKVDLLINYITYKKDKTTRN